MTNIFICLFAICTHLYIFCGEMFVQIFAVFFFFFTWGCLFSWSFNYLKNFSTSPLLNMCFANASLSVTWFSFSEQCFSHRRGYIFQWNSIYLLFLSWFILLLFKNSSSNPRSLRVLLMFYSRSCIVLILLLSLWLSLLIFVYFFTLWFFFQINTTSI